MSALATPYFREDDRRRDQIIGESPAIRSVLDKVGCVALTDATVHVRGETGTGKELIPHAIHNLSSGRERPFMKLNCAAIPFDFLERTFWTRKGAFTGAIAQKIGRFEMADRGTLFLDEIGDIPLGSQPIGLALDLKGGRMFITDHRRLGLHRQSRWVEPEDVAVCARDGKREWMKDNYIQKRGRKRLRAHPK